MHKIRDETIESANIFLEAQRKEENTKLTINIFSTTSNFICDAVDITKFEGFNKNNYQPEGWTALVDAVALSVIKTNNYLLTLPEDKRPDVIFCIITDGQENMSKSYTTAQLNEMVKFAQDNGWGFNFLGANIDAFSVAKEFGITPNGVANFDVDNIAAATSALNSQTMRYRSATARGMTKSLMTYSVEERSSMKKDI